MNGQAVAADFLGRLVDRARGLDSGLRPRLPSLYEPTRSTGVDLAMDTEPTKPIDEGVEHYVLQPVRENRGTPAPHAARIAEEPREETATAGSGRPHVPEKPPEIRIDPSLPAPLAPASRAASHARPAIDSRPVPQESNTPAPRPGGVRAALSGALGETAPSVAGSLAAGAPAAARSPRRTADLASATAPAPPGKRAAPEERSAAKPDARPPTKSGVLVPAPEPAVRRIVVVEPQTTRRRPAPEQARIETPAAAATPVINVTIGRVEVRAVQTPSAPQRAETQGPRPMNLDDYLKRREGRR